MTYYAGPGNGARPASKGQAMRTEQEQIAGLKKVVAMATAVARVNCAIGGGGGDVVTLAAAIGEDAEPSDCEIVYASGGYDVWREGRLKESDLTAAEAVKILVTDYMEKKACIILDRIAREEGAEAAKSKAGAVVKKLAEYTFK